LQPTIYKDVGCKTMIGTPADPHANTDAEGGHL